MIIYRSTPIGVANDGLPVWTAKYQGTGRIASASCTGRRVPGAGNVHHPALLRLMAATWSRAFSENIWAAAGRTPCAAACAPDAAIERAAACLAAANLSLRETCPLIQATAFT
jgi:hypothetical protein